MALITNVDGSRMLNLNRRDIYDLGAPISNFAMPEFDNPTVLENNVEIRAIPGPTSDETVRVLELLVRAVAPTASGRPRTPTTCCRVMPGSSLDICSPVVQAERREAIEIVSNITFMHACLAEAAAH
jgi:hypothetical protein